MVSVKTVLPYILFIIILLTPFIYFTIFPPIIPCALCDESTFWYKCQEGTGKGSDVCNEFKKGDIAVRDIQREYQTIRTEIDALDAKLKKPFVETERALANITQKFNINVPSVRVPNLSIPGLNCGIKVPVINQNIDPCGLINAPINASTGLINKGLGEITGQIENLFKEIVSQFNPIIADLKNQLTIILNNIQQPWIKVQKEMSTFKTSLVNVIALAQKDIVGTLTYGMAESLQKTFPSMTITSLTIISVILLLLPVIGGYYSIFVMLFDFSELLSKFVDLSIPFY